MLTPVTASNSGLASGCWAGTFCHPLRNPAPKAPQSPPPEMIRMSITGGSFRPPAVYRSYSALVRSSNRPSTLRAFCYGLFVAFGAQFQEILLA